MNAIEKLPRFTFEGLEVRVSMKDGEPLFCAGDVCRVLDIANPSDALGRLEEDEKGIVSTETLGGRQDLLHVSEAGLYRLVLGSRKPEAKRFQRWVTHDVLPAIRKTGNYSSAAPSAALDVRTMAQLARSVLALTEQVEQKDRLLAEAAPKVEFYDRFAGSDGHPGLMQAAKQLHQPERKFCDWLRREGFLYYDGERVLVPYGKYGPTGSHLFEVRSWTVNDVVRRQTVVTAKGLQFLAARLPLEYPKAHRAPLPRPHGAPLALALPGSSHP